MSPRVDGGRALAVWGGEPGAVVSGDVEEGVEEEVSDASPGAGRLGQGDCRMRWVVPKVWSRSTSRFLSPQRCWHTAVGLCRA